MRSIFILLGSIFILITNLKAQTLDKTKSYNIAAVGFWNVENLYDTLNDPEKQDEEFLPDGSYVWNGSRYKKKIEHLSDVISEMAVDATPDGLAILGLCEIENKNVLVDLVAAPKLKSRNYQIVHFEGPDARGVDPALLYNPKYFKLIKAVTYRLLLPTDTAHKTRDQLVVSGSLNGEALTIIVNHWPSRRGGELLSKPNRIAAAKLARQIADSIIRLDPKNKVMIIGDLNDDPPNESVKKHIKTYSDINRTRDDEMFNPMENLYKQGIGTLAWEDAWNLFDQIIMNKPFIPVDLKSGYKTFQYYKAVVFNKPYLRSDFGNFKGYPFRTYSGSTYTAGYSDHFPVYVLLLREKI